MKLYGDNLYFEPLKRLRAARETANPNVLRRIARAVAGLSMVAAGMQADTTLVFETQATLTQEAHNQPVAIEVVLPAAALPPTSDRALLDIPSDYLQLYQSAGVEFGIDWTILAGIGKIESDHGRYDALGVQAGQNFHGCCAGPMQFFNNQAMAEDYGMTQSTWAAFGQDRTGDGIADVYNPAEAIPSAASYLVASGIHVDLNAALLAYNNSDQYRLDVLAEAAGYTVG